MPGDEDGQWQIGVGGKSRDLYTAFQIADSPFWFTYMPNKLERQHRVASVTVRCFALETKRKYTLNATELARNKFNALFAAHDAKEIRSAEEEQNSSKTVTKEATKNVKPQ